MHHHRKTDSEEMGKVPPPGTGVAIKNICAATVAFTTVAASSFPIVLPFPKTSDGIPQKVGAILRGSFLGGVIHMYYTETFGVTE